MGMDAHGKNQFQQAGKRTVMFMGKAARFVGVLLLAMFATTAPVQAAVESVPYTVLFINQGKTPGSAGEAVKV